MEVFTSITGYEGLYEVSNLGRVKSLERFVQVTRYGKQRMQYVPERVRVCSKHGTGYLTIRLAAGGVVKTHRVHRLVAEAFLPNPNNKPTVNHIDGNKHNNCVSNLEWATQSEQQLHAMAHGLFGLVNSPINGQFTAKE